ncbi:MAG: GNAT family N-acetyltransferase [SAR202 cluster bacterium]|jgi:ribosomal-protein-serine acetyltransferase|nr:GNAT family N-acetyltransferase [SAR202 cluster bacterium]|tara:strand:+ start:10788 stop:11342 length:555 start_codon:yes stop_codon:yes gene_type:complete
MFSHRIDEDTELRLHHERHADELFVLVDRNRAYLWEWLPWLDGTVTADDERDFIKASLEFFGRGELLPMGIWHLGKLVGTVGFTRVNSSNRAAEIGYCISEDQQEKGLITRACTAMIAYGFNELDYNRIVIRAAVDNLPSRAVPERLGFTYEGTERQSEWHYDHFKDVAAYSMLADEWRSLEQS